MSNITITIETSVIGTEPTNSVNARDLHTNLGVRKRFTDWVKAQINSLALDENVDFITYHQKGIGGKFDSVDYILTLDTAKHIAMASRTPRGKEVRNYFIEAEKKLNQIGEAYRNQTPAFDPAPFLYEMQKQNALIVDTMNHLSRSLENVSAMTRTVLDGQSSIMNEMKLYREDMEHHRIDARRTSFLYMMGRLNEPVETPKPSMINDDQSKKLYSLITSNAKSISERTGIDTGVIAAGIFSRLKDRYHVAGYTHLTTEQYPDAVLWVGTIKTTM